MTKQKHTKAVSAASKAEELLPLEQMMSQGSAYNEGDVHAVGDTNQVKDSEQQGTEGEGASLVPKLRFVDFVSNGKWFISSVAAIADVSRGLVYSPAALRARNQGALVIRSSNISDDGDFLCNSDDVFVAKHCVNIPFADNGDIIITAANGSIRLVGKHAILRNVSPSSAVHGGFMLKMTPKYDSEFLNASMGSSWYIDYLQQNIAGGNGAIGNIKASDLLCQELPIPQLKEQQRIGALFKELDHNIELNRGLLDKLTQLKKSMLEQMFPREGESVPRLRFAGFTEPWRVTVLSDIAIAVRGGSPRPIEAYLTDSADGLNWIRIGDATSGSKIITSCREKICREGLSKTRLIPKGSLILSNSMSFGHPYILGIDGCIHDGWLALSDFDQHVNIDYFYYVLTSPWIQQQFTTKAQSSTVKNLDLSRVKSTLLPLPSLDEQQFIGAFLSSFDQCITQQRAKLEKLGQLKKALLKQMFV